MQVSTSGYYDWQNRDQDISKIKAVEDLLKKIKASYESSDSTYGSPRITKDLQRQGIQILRTRVARIMKKEGYRVSSARNGRYQQQLRNINSRYVIIR